MGQPEDVSFAWEGEAKPSKDQYNIFLSLRHTQHLLGEFEAFSRTDGNISHGSLENMGGGTVGKERYLDQKEALFQVLSAIILSSLCLSLCHRNMGEENTQLILK